MQPLLKKRKKKKEVIIHFLARRFLFPQSEIRGCDNYTVVVNRFPGNVYSVNYIFLRGAEADILLFRFQVARRHRGVREHRRSEKGVIFLRFDRLVIARLSVLARSFRKKSGPVFVKAWKDVSVC